MNEYYRKSQHRPVPADRLQFESVRARVHHVHTFGEGPDQRSYLSGAVRSGQIPALGRHDGTGPDGQFSDSVILTAPYNMNAERHQIQTMNCNFETGFYWNIPTCTGRPRL